MRRTVKQSLPVASERQEQRALIQWWASYCRTKGLDERLMLAIPGGTKLFGDAKQRAIQAASLKKEGARSGAPDLLLLVTTKDYYGFAIEMKRSDWTDIRNVHEKAQYDYLLLLQKQGYMGRFAHGADHAIALIKQYLGD
jgi:hypothetical protein